ncbi:uncharacterized protein AMSG_05024 [Thecamonas trahens ATCC 50062]|uniref:Tetratricopeptide repeat protein n=1 Tax=Thecamonas trahens ATCC 50062 TaxID=461836 RepID=A0A0L0DAH4_THETB|nr:hypothetical protein AMSG_05024 [Thecamonas trahens ATCC 50062]KNC49066.1 hypothetical protein AMSG_05024 [Thecamonas trahens ATCC 50062]|eukprot:XP_013758097.1 hypothetical protein AMSG_05024 [Thecamonas trahens ATCC 50062]
MRGTRHRAPSRGGKRAKRRPALTTRALLGSARKARAAGDYLASLEMVETLAAAVEARYGLAPGALTGAAPTGPPSSGTAAVDAACVFVLTELALARFLTGAVDASRAAALRAEALADAADPLPPRVVAGLFLVLALVAEADGDDEGMAALLAAGSRLVASADAADALARVPFLLNTALLVDLPAAGTSDYTATGPARPPALHKATSRVAAALRILGSVFAPNSATLADAHLLAGVLADTAGDANKALAHYERAMADGATPETLRAALHNAGLIHADAGAYEDAFAAFRAVHAMLKGATEPAARLQRADAAMHMGLVLLATRRRAKAIALFRAVAATRIELLGVDHVLSAEVAGVLRPLEAAEAASSAVAASRVESTLSRYASAYAAAAAT